MTRARVVPEPIENPTSAMFATWVLYEDDDVVAVNKPAGVLSQGGEGGRGKNLVDLARAHYGGSTIGVAHRLDRNVSGVVLLARTHRAGRALAIAMQKSQVERLYAAVVRGTPTQDHFEIDAPLAKDERTNTVRVVGSGGAAARTQVDVERRFRAPIGACAVLVVRPISGRSHQIRVHLAHVQLPIVGDPKYGVLAAGLSRPLLHAECVRLRHPVTRAAMDLRAPRPWDDAVLARELRATDVVRRR